MEQIWVKEIQPLPSLTVKSQVGKVVKAKANQNKLEVLWWTKTQLKGKWQIRV